MNKKLFKQREKQGSEETGQLELPDASSPIVAALKRGSKGAPIIGPLQSLDQ
jgi:hypothetical protein